MDFKIKKSLEYMSDSGQFYASITLYLPAPDGYLTEDLRSSVLVLGEYCHRFWGEIKAHFFKDVKGAYRCKTYGMVFSSQSEAKEWIAKKVQSTLDEIREAKAQAEMSKNFTEIVNYNLEDL